jgi:DNA-binding NarL/FixJ family response regulator
MHHHLPVQRRGLGLQEHELLELHAEGWSSTVIATMLGLPLGEVGARLRSLCAALDIAPRADGCPPVTAARMWLVSEARNGAEGGAVVAA